MAKRDCPNHSTTFRIATRMWWTQVHHQIHLQYKRTWVLTAGKIYLYVSKGGKGWLGFLDLGCGKKLWWNWYFTLWWISVKSGGPSKSDPHSSPPRWCPWDLLRSFKVCSDAKERVGCGKQWETTAPIQSLVKQQPWFLSLWWKSCHDDIYIYLHPTIHPPIHPSTYLPGLTRAMSSTGINILFHIDFNIYRVKSFILGK